MNGGGEDNGKQVVAEETQAPVTTEERNEGGSVEPVEEANTQIDLKKNEEEKEKKEGTDESNEEEEEEEKTRTDEGVTMDNGNIKQNENDKKIASNPVASAPPERDIFWVFPIQKKKDFITTTVTQNGPKHVKESDDNDEAKKEEEQTSIHHVSKMGDGGNQNATKTEIPGENTSGQMGIKEEKEEDVDKKKEEKKEETGDSIKEEETHVDEGVTMDNGNIKQNENDKKMAPNPLLNSAPPERDIFWVFPIQKKKDINATVTQNEHKHVKENDDKDEAKVFEKQTNIPPVSKMDDDENQNTTETETHDEIISGQTEITVISKSTGNADSESQSITTTSNPSQNPALPEQARIETDITKEEKADEADEDSDANKKKEEKKEETGDSIKEGEMHEDEGASMSSGNIGQNKSDENSLSNPLLKSAPPERDIFWVFPIQKKNDVTTTVIQNGPKHVKKGNVNDEAKKEEEEKSVLPVSKMGVNENQNIAKTEIPPKITLKQAEIKESEVSSIESQDKDVKEKNDTEIIGQQGNNDKLPVDKKEDSINGVAVSSVNTDTSSLAPVKINEDSEDDEDDENMNANQGEFGKKSEENHEISDEEKTGGRENNDDELEKSEEKEEKEYKKDEQQESPEQMISNVSEANANDEGSSQNENDKNHLEQQQQEGTNTNNDDDIEKPLIEEREKDEEATIFEDRKNGDSTDNKQDKKIIDNNNNEEHKKDELQESSMNNSTNGATASDGGSSPNENDKNNLKQEAENINDDDESESKEDKKRTIPDATKSSSSSSPPPSGEQNVTPQEPILNEPNKDNNLDVKDKMKKEEYIESVPGSEEPIKSPDSETSVTINTNDGLPEDIPAQQISTGEESSELDVDTNENFGSSDKSTEVNEGEGREEEQILPKPEMAEQNEPGPDSELEQKSDLESSGIENTNLNEITTTDNNNIEDGSNKEERKESKQEGKDEKVIEKKEKDEVKNEESGVKKDEESVISDNTVSLDHSSSSPPPPSGEQNANPPGSNEEPIEPKQEEEQEEEALTEEKLINETNDTQKLEEEKNGIENEMNNLHDKNKMIEDDIQIQIENRKKLGKEIEGLKSKLEELKSSNENLNTQLNTQHEEVDKLNEDRERLINTNKDLEAQIRTQQEEVEKLKSEKEQLTHINNDLETQIRTQQQQIENLKSEKEQFTITNKDLEAQINTQQEEVDKLNKEKEKLTNTNKDLETQINTKKQEVGNLKSEKEQLTNTNKDLETQIRTQQQQIENLKSEKDKLINTNENLKKETNSKQTEVSKLETENRIIKNKVEELENEQKIIVDTNKKLEETRKELNDNFKYFTERAEKLKSANRMISVMRKSKKIHSFGSLDTTKDTDVYCEKCQKIYPRDSVLFGEHYKLYKNTHKLIKVKNKEEMQDSIIKQLNSYKEILIANKDRDIKMLEKLGEDEKKTQDKLDKVFTKLHNDINKKRELTLAAIGIEELTVGKGIFDRIEGIIEAISKFNWDGRFIFEFLDIVSLFEKYKSIPRNGTVSGITPIYNENIIKTISDKINEISIGALVVPILHEENSTLWNVVKVSSTHCNDLLEAEYKEACDDDTKFVPIFKGKDTKFVFAVPHPGSSYTFRARVHKEDFVSGWSFPLTVQTKCAAWEPNTEFDLSRDGAIATYKGNDYGDVCTLPITYVKNSVGVVKWSVSIENTKKSYIFIGIDDGKKKLMLCCRDGKIYRDPKKPSTLRYAKDIRGLNVKSEIVVVLDYENNSLSYEINGNSYGHASSFYDDDATEEDISNIKFAVTLTSCGDSIKLNDVEIKPLQ